MPLSEGTHKSQAHWGLREKALHRSLGQTYLLVPEGLLGGGRCCGSLQGH